MSAYRLNSLPVTEDLLARLTVAAYQVVLNHGLQTPFLEVELELWRELRAVLDREAEAVDEVLSLSLVEARVSFAEVG